MDICKIIPENRRKVFESKGFETVEDVQEFFPRKYYDFSSQKSLEPIYDGSYVAIIGTVREITTKKTNNILMVMAKVYDEITGRRLNLIWIGAYYIYKFIEDWEGERVIACGKLTYKEEFHSFHMSNPIIFDKQIEKNLTIFPVYKKLSKISEDYMEETIERALEQPITDNTPAELVKAHKLLSRAEAIRTMHRPKSMTDLNNAKKRLIYDKLLYFASELESEKRRISKGTIYNIKSLRNTQAYIDSLPYQLTPSQESVFLEMSQKAKDGMRINALIQGDVGSGKTTSAFLMMFAMADSGYQSLLMAPTVILATQHYENLKASAEKYGYKVALLAGKQTAKEKKAYLKGIANGEYTFIIGTHSVISEKVVFHNLALAVVDEEHKFGVKQREKLTENAARGMHSISMSATPIPRTIATAAYGDNICVYDLEVPATRKPVQTAISNSNNVIFEFIEKKLEAGQQVYVVCPYITDDSEEGCGIETVEDAFKSYCKRFNTYGEENVGMVTGKMKQQDSDEVIRRFAAGEIKILISTTVIEVGVNVPNANVIVINNAERFGLAQLHQLRGRVGRGSMPGYCILKSADKENPRLKTLCSTTNGYLIAEEDMRLRGTGDLLGTEQTGTNEYIQLMIEYPNMYEVVKKDARYIVDRGINLCETA